MQDKNLFRVVQPPADSDHQRAAIIEAVMKEAERIEIDNSTLIKFMISKRLHRWFGVHFWVAWRMYDPTSSRFIDTGGQVCCFCATAR
jgi:hypothetical protein